MTSDTEPAWEDLQRRVRTFVRRRIRNPADVDDLVVEAPDERES